MKAKIISCLVSISIIFFSCHDNNIDYKKYNDMMQLSPVDLFSISFYDCSVLSEI